MKTRREQIEEAAMALQNEDFKNNPNGYDVSPWSNTDTISEAFARGAEWADANPLTIEEFCKTQAEIRDYCNNLQSKLTEMAKHVIEVNEKNSDLIVKLAAAISALDRVLIYTRPSSDGHKIAHEALAKIKGMINE